MIRRQGGMRQAGCALNVMHCGAAQAYRLRRCPHDSRNTAIPLRKIVMKKLILSVVATLSLAACATTEGLTNAEELALYRTHAGEPVQAFQYTGHLNGWVPIGDTALAVWTRLSAMPRMASPSSKRRKAPSAKPTRSCNGCVNWPFRLPTTRIPQPTARTSRRKSTN